MTSASKFSGIAGALLCLCATVRAQPTSALPASAPPGLPLIAHVDGAGIDAEALRVALANELGLSVERVESSDLTHVQIDGAALDALHVAFVRADGSKVERTVDVSSMRDQAAEAAALLAANLMRDEASELLADLQAASRVALPLSAAPTALPLPAPAPQLQAPVLEVPRGCDPRPQLRPVVAGADVVPYVGTDGKDSANVERGMSFALFGGLTGAVRGAEFATLFNLNERGTCGVQFSGLGNLSGGPTEGAQLALANWTHGRLDGAQLDLIGVATGDVYGAQLGLVNVAGGGIVGAQLGLGNVAAAGVEGAQIGLANLDAGELNGAQIGLLNLANKRLHGTQVGLLNVGSGALEGAQVGLLNVSSAKVQGTQIGLVNVAEDGDVAVGLLNVMWHGETHLAVWGTDAGLAMLGIEHGGRYVYNLYGVGATARDNRFVLSSAFGIGAHVYRWSWIFVNVDVVGYGLYLYDKAQSHVDIATIIALRVPVGFQLIKGLAVFVAPTLNVSIADATNNLLSDPSLLSSRRLTNSTASTEVRFWAGFSAGVRFF
jgi:hypothetical protein